MKKITVSAPGKLMLLGEHAVVYSRPCIVTAVNQRMKAIVELTDQPAFQLNAPDVNIVNYQKPMHQIGNGDIPKGAKFVEIAIGNFLASHPFSRSCHSERSEESSTLIRHLSLEDCHVGRRLPPRNDKLGIRVTTASEFSSLFGFGSSSASAVCVIKALSELTRANLDNKGIFDLAYKTVLDIQGKGSGFDVAAAVFGRTLYFVKGGQTIELLKVNSLPLIVGYSGIKADTVTIINQVLEKAKKDPQVVEDIYDTIGKLVQQAKLAILKQDLPGLGKLIDKNQTLLVKLGVSIKKLDDMILAAKDAGAYGAKLSGAGGGDCMIALAPEDKIQAVKDGIISAGGQVIEVEANTEGVRIEESLVLSSPRMRGSN